MWKQSCLGVGGEGCVIRRDKEGRVGEPMVDF